MKTTGEILRQLREKNGLSQTDLANRLHVTRQAVSRWENNETMPNPETLKDLSNVFKVSVHTILGSPVQLFCQCCGMPLTDEILAENEDGSLNEQYCKWCLTQGVFAYPDLDALVEFMAEHYPMENATPEETRRQYTAYLQNLKHWQNTEDENKED